MPPAGNLPAFLIVRISSRARASVRNGPSPFFASAKLPDQSSFPFGAT